MKSPLIPVLAHLAIALGLWARGMRFCGVNGGLCGWDWMWQGIPEVDLLHQPWSSLWYLHAQPPGFSLWGLAWLHAFGPENFPDSIQFGHMALGGLIVGMTWRLARDLGVGRRTAWLAAAGMAVNPSLLLYEAYPVYSVLVVSLVLVTAVCLGRTLICAARRNGGGTAAWLAGFGAALNALALTRSLYHWAFIWVALALAWPAWRRLGRRARIVLLVSTLAPVGMWYGKNLAQYGFFGGSSWFGLGLYKCVSNGYDYRDLARFRAEGLIPDYVEENRAYMVFPDEYRRYGFTRTSDVPLLAANTYHNINVIAISKGYGKAAMRLIRHDPGHYALNIARGLGIYCEPPTRFIHLDNNRYAFLETWESLVARWFQGTAFTDILDNATRIHLGSMMAFWLPVLFVWGAWWSARRWRRGGRHGLDRARALLMAYLQMVTLYVGLVGAMFEVGENMRFRAATEPLTWVMTLVMLAGAWRATPERVRRKLMFRKFKRHF